MMGLYLGDKRAAIYKGDAKPINLYQGAQKIAGWKWQEQSSTDMPFEATYNDRVDVVALGRSKQDGEPSPDYPSPIISSAGEMRVEDHNGNGVQIDTGILRAIPDGAGGWAARDELYVERVGGEWHLMRRQRVEHLVMTGAEAWVQTSSVVSGYRVVALQVPAAPNNAPSMCTHFTRAGTEVDTTNERLALSLHAHNLRLKIASHRLTTDDVTGVKAWLASRYATGSPVTVDYVLATPIITDLGPIDLPSYYPYTRVLVEGEYPPEVTARCRVVDG